MFQSRLCFYKNLSTISFYICQNIYYTDIKKKKKKKKKKNNKKKTKKKKYIKFIL